MKSIKILFTVTALMLAVTSCSIDENITDRPNPGIIKTENDVNAVIRGLYARFNDAGSFKFRGWLMLSLAADDLYSPSAAEFGPFAKRTFTNVDVEPFYESLFHTIGAANDLIKVLDGLALKPAFMKRAYGEAHFIRAFCYYYLVRLYGGVPLRTVATGADSELYLKRASVDDIYKQIFDDFQIASISLPLASQINASELGRASKGAAQSILAQAYLTYGNQQSLKGQSPNQYYDKAIVYADSVISSNQYSLLNNYADLFDVNKEQDAYKEVIFGIRFQVDLQQSLVNSSGSEFAYRCAVGNTHFVTGNAPYGTGSGDVRPMPWTADLYRRNTLDYASADGTVIDYRNETAFMQKGYQSVQNKYYVTYPNIPGTNDGIIPTPLIGKYIDPKGRDMRNHGNDFFIMRFAEVYLIKAEALNELYGPSPDALAAFNQLRARARKANGTTRAVPQDINAITRPGVVASKSLFRLRIFYERGLEMLGEGQRWFDLVRMQHPDNASKTMYEYQFLEELAKTSYPKTFPTYNATTKKWSNSNAVYAQALNVTVPKYLLFPIPNKEMTRNPNFGGQNPGW